MTQDVKNNIHIRIRRICLLKILFIFVFVHQKNYSLHSGEWGLRVRARVKTNKEEGSRATEWPWGSGEFNFCWFDSIGWIPRCTHETKVGPSWAQKIQQSKLDLGLRQDYLARRLSSLTKGTSLKLLNSSSFYSHIKIYDTDQKYYQILEWR